MFHNVQDWRIPINIIRRSNCGVLVAPQSFEIISLIIINKFWNNLKLRHLGRDVSTIVWWHTRTGETDYPFCCLGVDSQTCCLVEISLPPLLTLMQGCCPRTRFSRSWLTWWDFGWWNQVYWGCCQRLVARIVAIVKQHLNAEVFACFEGLQVEN